MKTHTVKTPIAELLVVELSESAKIQSFSFEKKGFDGIAIIEKGKEPFLIKAHFTLLGKPDEIREEDARELVYQDDGEFADYKHDANWFSTAKESLLSLLESEIFWDNPLGNDDGTDGEGYVEDKIMHTEWHEAEQKTFNRNRSVIFKKVTPKM